MRALEKNFKTYCKERRQGILCGSLGPKKLPWEAEEQLSNKTV